MIKSYNSQQGYELLVSTQKGWKIIDYDFRPNKRKPYKTRRKVVKLTPDRGYAFRCAYE